MIVDALYWIFRGDSTNLKKAAKEGKAAVADLGDTASKTDKELDKMGKSFVKVVENAGEAAAAIFTFSAFKAGAIDATKFNSALQVQAQLMGINVVELNRYAKAAEQAGGSAQAFVQNLFSINQDRVTKGLAPVSAQQFVEQYRKSIGQSNDPAYKRLLAKSSGGDAGFQNFLLDDSVYSKAMEGAAESTKNASESMFKAGRSLEAGSDKFSQTAQTYFGKLSQGLSGFLNALFGAEGGVANAAGSSSGAAVGAGAGALVGGGLLGGWLSTKIGTTIWNLIKGGGAAAAGGAEAGVSAAGAAEGGAAVVGGALALPELLLLLAGLGIGAGAAYLFGKGKSSGSGSNSALPAVSTKTNAMGFWMSKGYSREDAAALAAQEEAESGGDPNARGDGGKAFGAYQWHLPRVMAILNGTGIDVRTANLQQQREAADWELHQMGLVDGLRNSQGIGAKSAFLTRNYERPADISGESFKRARIAMSMVGSGAAAGSGGRDISVTIDKVIIQTQATDAQGISRDAAPALITAIRSTIANYDDGVLA